MVASENIPTPLGVTIEKATPLLVQQYAPLLREADRAEIEAAFGPGLSVEFILQQGLDASIECWSMTFGGELACLWGVSVLRENIHGQPVDYDPYREVACGWLLTTHAVSRHPKTFWLCCAAIFPAVLDRYPMLLNWIDARHVQALRWARKMGFHVEPPAPHGELGLPFHKFKITKEALRCALPQ